MRARSDSVTLDDLRAELAGRVTTTEEEEKKKEERTHEE